MTLRELWEKDEEHLSSLCKKNALFLRFLNDDKAQIVSGSGTWLILREKKQRVALYHKNTAGEDDTSPVPGFHRQATEHHTINGLLRYIIKHDSFRRRFPIGNPADEMPIGRKKKKKYAKRAKQVEQIRSIAYVDAMLEELSRARVENDESNP